MGRVLPRERAARNFTSHAAAARSALRPHRPVPRHRSPRSGQRRGRRAGSRAAAALTPGAVDEEASVRFARRRERLPARRLDGDQVGKLARHVLAVLRGPARPVHQNERDRARTRPGTRRIGVRVAGRRRTVEASIHRGRPSVLRGRVDEGATAAGTRSAARAAPARGCLAIRCRILVAVRRRRRAAIERTETCDEQGAPDVRIASPGPHESQRTRSEHAALSRASRHVAKTRAKEGS
jgi:hypothetical protein